jgi:hypothetical protein
MNWTALVGPAVLAAVISVIGIWISARTASSTARLIHAEKLQLDRVSCGAKSCCRHSSGPKEVRLGLSFGELETEARISGASA